MYYVKDLWQELNMAVKEQNKSTEKQQSIFDFCGCGQYSGIVWIHDVYMDYTENIKQCSRDYFYDVLSTRWPVFKEDGKMYVDFDSPIGELWTLESSSPAS